MLRPNPHSAFASARPVHGLLALGAGAVAALAAACATTKEAAPPPAPTAAPTPYSHAIGLSVAELANRSGDLVASVERLISALEGGDMTGARNAYVAARAPYEEIEVLRADFPELHRAIDGRAGDFAKGELDPAFTGFHAIEVALFARSDAKGALSHAIALEERVNELRDRLRQPSGLDAAACFQGMIERTGEVAWRTITSEEETWSDATLTVIRHNWMGVHAMYRNFSGSLRDKDGLRAEHVDRAYQRALEVIAEDFPVGQETGTPYSIVDRAKRRRIADASLSFRARLVDAAKALDLAVDA